MKSLRPVSRALSTARAFSTTTPRSLAKMQLIGRLADTPAAYPTSTGRDIIRYSLGVNGSRKDENGNRTTSWFNVASFAEGAQKDFLTSLQKGSLLYVEAEAKMDSYQDKDGNNRTSLNLLARNFEALSRPRTEEGESSGNAVEEPMSGIGAS